MATRRENKKNINVFTAEDELRLARLEIYRSTGNISSTKEKKAVKAEIARLEDLRDTVQEESNQERNEEIKDALREILIEIPTLEEREEEAGLVDTTIGDKLDMPTLEEREAANNLVDTTAGRDDQQQTQSRQVDVGTEETPNEEAEDQFGTFGIIICINGEPFNANIYGQIGGKLA